jgi:hypothetical protein
MHLDPFMIEHHISISDPVQPHSGLLVDKPAHLTPHTMRGYSHSIPPGLVITDSLF